MLTPIPVLCDCLYQDILRTERFPKFADAGCSQERFVCVSNVEYSHSDIWQHLTSFANRPPRAQDCQDLPAK